ncbi:hypothetical protein F5888DRAFT_1800384 [Russula emetica]|nr:hypothetical protein F5888DRAFT_1800384 [Russula emetica]
MSTPGPSLLSSSCSLELHWQHCLICITHPTKMRRYDIVSGILLILSIIDFALAAPVLVQERPQAGIDVAHIPKDVMIVLGKRKDEEELEKLLEKYFETGGKPVDSSGAHAPSSSAPSDSAPPGPDHGSTNVVQSPAPNPASSTANPDPLIEGPSSTAALQGSWEYHFNAAWDDVFSNKGDDEFIEPADIPALTPYDSDHELTGAHAPQGPQPNPKKRPLTDPDPDFDWGYWMNKDSPPRPRPAPPKEFGQAHEYQIEVEHVQDESPWPSPGTSTEEEWATFDALNKVLLPGPASPEEFSQAYEYQVEHVQQPKPGPSADPYFNWDYWMNLKDPPPSRPSPSKLSIPESSNPGPSNLESSNPEPLNPGTSNPSLPTEPELRPDDQSLSADSQMDNVQAALYAAKGKAKQLRRISGTARDVGNAAQRELQLAC